ncbi:MAG: hypothetical protein LBI67_10655 [Treponema sp.]|jgi:hypothetical protein|nr:hypothetical protein [Treponema sp.]
MAFLRSKRHRTVRNCKFLPLAAFVFLPFLSAAQETPQNIEKRRREVTDEADLELVRMNIYDSEVSLIIDGFWKGALSANWGISSGPLGIAPDSGDSPLLFTQEADITLSLWIREKWFLEASFLDDYNLNTYRAGYQGFPGETIQYAGVGNTGLDFPVFPYLDLGGESQSSFGAYGRFGSGDLTFHTLARYDAAAREERTFVGNRERSFSNLSPDKPMRGLSFTLPEQNISVPVVYLEDSNGPLSGGGRRWRLANPSEYAAGGTRGVVELAREPTGMVAVSYGTGVPWQTAMGDYSTGFPGYTPGTNFLGDTQYHFDNTRNAVRLEDYPQPGDNNPGDSDPQTGRPGTISINGVDALVIYEPGTFSPFERQSRYRSPSAAAEDAALVQVSTGERISGFEMIPAESILLMDIPLYTLSGDASQRGIFELVPAAAYNTQESMWPLAGDYPEIYLPGKQAFTEDISVRFTNYGAAGEYNIGTDVVPGSVQVYRGGIQDPQIRYDSGSGTVRLSSPVGFNEVIRVSYLKRSEERRLGSFAAGVGLVYRPEEKPFSWEAALGLRWNVSGETYTEEGAASPGTVGFGGKASWDYDRLKAGVSLGLGFEQPDTTGLYRAAGMEGNSEIVMGLSTSRAFISEPASSVPPTPIFSSALAISKRADLIYRNYRNADIFGVSKLMNIDWSAPVVSGRQGPYPALDEPGEIFAAEFDLDADTPPGKNWTGFEVPLGEDGALLERAKAVVIPLRYYNFSTSTPNITVAAQFGVLADPETGAVENVNLIVEKNISPPPALPSGWVNDSSVFITFTDADRRKLRNATHMRVVIVNNDPAPLSGRLLAAKPYIMGASWRAVTVDSGSITGAVDPDVSLAEVRDPALNNSAVSRLHRTGANHVLKVGWKVAPGLDAAGADGRVNALSLSQYRVVSFFLKTPQGIPESPAIPTPFDSFKFIVARGPSSLGNAGETALEAVIPYTALSSPGEWVKVELHYGGGEKEVLIDGVPAAGALLDYRPGVFRTGTEDALGTAYIAAYVESSSPLADGTFSIDEICLEEPAPSYRANTGTTFEWIHPEAVVSAGDLPVISNLSLNAALETGVSGDPFAAESETFAGMQSRSRAGVTILDTAVTGNLSFTVSNDLSYWSAGHSVARSFGPLSIDERFNTAPYDKNFDHRLSVNLGTLLHSRLSSTINYEIKRLRRTWDFSMGVDAVQNEHPGFYLGGDLVYVEKTDRVESWISGYGETWARSFPEMVIDSGSSGTIAGGVQNRDARGRIGFNLNRTPLGANISFEGNSSVSIPLVSTQSSSRGVLSFPFILGPVSGVLSSERNFRRGIRHTGGAVGEDIEQYGGSLYASSPLWFSVPVYAIFDPGLNGAMDKTLEGYAGKNENTRWNELLSLNLLFPERYDPLSLVIPVNFSSRIDRTLEQRLDTRLDVFTVSSTMGFSGVNLFGSMGTYSLFNFYRNDEFRHSVSGLFSFPKNEDPAWRLQAEQNLNFFGSAGAELGITNTLTTGSSGWVESLAVLWTVPAERTLLSRVYDGIMGRLGNTENFPGVSSLAQSEYERLRRESLELVIDKTGDYGEYSVILGHESLVRILGRLTLSAFSKLNVNRNEYGNTLSFMLSLGTSLTVTF